MELSSVSGAWPYQANFDPRDPKVINLIEDPSCLLVRAHRARPYGSLIKLAPNPRDLDHPFGFHRRAMRVLHSIPYIRRFLGLPLIALTVIM